MSKTLALLCWAVIASAMLLTATLPISVPAQFAFGIAIIAVMLCLYPFRTGGLPRDIFLALGTAVVLRYVYWRVTSTLPSPEHLSDFIPAMVVLAAELFCVLMLALSLFVTADPIDRPVAPTVPDAEAPSVDVFVPSYNESAQLVAVTLAAAASMRYPAGKLHVHLLDDGGTDQKCEQDDPERAAQAQARRAEMQALCADLGVNYLTRERNVRAKAGNLNAGLGNTSADLVVVFDADHAPAAEFLEQTVGHFVEKPDLFLVQTPHFFLNPDPVERNLSTFARMPSENEMFYGTIQRGLDKWNASFFCGSAAVLRRTALEDVGGFSGNSITEDCETALELHARGWHSLYIDRPMIAGLQPETLSAFIGQRSRWCVGMIQILMMSNPLFRRGLTMAQRLCYLSSSLYWLFPFPTLVFLLSPLLYIFFNMKIYVASQQEFIAYTALYMIVNMLMQSYNHGRVRWPWISELYEYIQSVQLIRPLIGVLISPRKPAFNVTAKNITLAEDQLSGLSWPYFGLFGILAAAEALVVYRYSVEPAARDLLSVIAIWNTFNLLMAGLALGVVSERRERREAPRVDIKARGLLAIGTATVEVAVTDVSLGGVRVAPLSGKLVIPPGVRLGELSLRRGAETLTMPVSFSGVRSQDTGRGFGLRFHGVSRAQYQAVAQLLYADLAALRRMRGGRRRALGILRGTAQFVGWSLMHSLRGFYYALFRRSAAKPAQDSRRTIDAAAGAP